MQYTILPVTPFQQNCSVLWCDATRHAVVIDPGGEADRILRVIEQNTLRVEKILLTHGHLDHVGGATELAAALQAPILGPQQEDAFWFQALGQQCQMFGASPVAAFMPDQWLTEGEQIHFGEETLAVLHCPGHTPGHVVFVNHAAKLALTGDVLFKGSIGRTDFPRGDYDTLMRSIKEKLLPLGDDMRFISGHGPMSDFGEERRTNPFLN